MSVKKQLLIIEPNAEMRTLLIQFLGESHTVYACAQAPEAISCMKSQQIDAIILCEGIQNPEAIEFINYVSANTMFAHTPLIYIAREEKGDETTHIHSHIHTQLFKPFHLAALSSIISVLSTASQPVH